MDETLTSAPTAQEKLAKIQAHLASGGKVMTVTYTKATIYSKKHVDMFSATDKDLFVQRGKGRDCLNFTCIKFSR